MLFISKLSSVTVGYFLRKIDSACPEKNGTEILSDSDH